jgi:hypothetical protein
MLGEILLYRNFLFIITEGGIMEEWP